MHHLRDIGEQMRDCDCECGRWPWGLNSLQTGVTRDAAGKPHHPSCKCAAGVIGCRKDVVTGSLPGALERRCAEHGAP